MAVGQRSRPLRVVLDDVQPVSIGDRSDSVDIVRLAEQIRDHHRLGSRRDAPLDRLGIQAEVLRLNVREDGLVTSIGTEKGWRRSIYVRQRRKEMPTILENFDLPQMIPNCIVRPSSTVASQALHLMNDTLIRELTGHFAERVKREAGNNLDRQIERVYQVALSRPPSDQEREIGREVLVKLTEQWKKQLENAESQNSSGDPSTR